MVEERRANAERDRAVAAETRAEAEAAKARNEGAINKAVNDFLLQDLLAQASPNQQPDRDLKLRTVLDRAAARIDGRFPGMPAVEAAIRSTLGQTLVSLGEMRQASAAASAQFGEEHLPRTSTKAIWRWRSITRASLRKPNRSGQRRWRRVAANSERSTP